MLIRCLYYQKATNRIIFDIRDSINGFVLVTFYISYFVQNLDERLCTVAGTINSIQRSNHDLNNILIINSILLHMHALLCSFIFIHPRFAFKNALGCEQLVMDLKLNFT